MTTSKAYAICKRIDSDEYSVQEKGTAIFIVLNMETHNGVTKGDLLGIVKYLFNLCFDVRLHDGKEGR